MFNKKITEEQFEKIQFETTEEYQHGQLVMSYVSDLIRIQEYGLKRYYAFQKKWAWVLAVVTIGIIFFSYLGVYLGGIGILHFSDDVLLALIAAGTFQNLLTLYVTRHFFPKIVSISDHFGNDKILNFINNYRNR